MAQIKDILQEEQKNDGSFIRLYAEGIFYKAYERSAWTACRVLHPFMVKKRAVRKVGQEVVSIGFPKTSLQKWAGSRRVEDVGDEAVLIYLSKEEFVLFDEKEFEEWKAGAVWIADRKPHFTTIQQCLYESLRPVYETCAEMQGIRPVCG
ncbi:MAG: hypothetical protein IKJ42_10215 [Bacteroidaceae bacterium]|nr:hypothetical protein [Bacteroidaceae bacterium]